MAIQLNKKQRLAAEALAEGAGVVEAARRSGLHYTRVSRLRRHPEFRAYLRELGADVIEDVRARLRRHSALAVDALVSVLESPKAPHSAKVTAANTLLARVVAGADAELEAGASMPDAALQAVLERMRGVAEVKVRVADEDALQGELAAEDDAAPAPLLEAGSGAPRGPQ